MEQSNASPSHQQLVKNRTEIKKLRVQNEKLAQRNRILEARVEALQGEIDMLRQALEAARRGGKRQATPFSKGDPKKEPKKPGRKPGKKYGRRGRRPRPKAEDIDEILDAPLPGQCPHCGGTHIEEGETFDQFVTDIPVPAKTHTILFNVHTGCCQQCHRRIQGTHPRQHSDALGAAANMIGPNVMALAAELNKVLGVGYQKLSRLFEVAYGLKVGPSTLNRGLSRLARRAVPAYDHLVRELQRSKAIYPDETGWKVGGKSAWLWVFVGDEATVYLIDKGRGFAAASKVLDREYSGILGRDGWQSYDLFKKAKHQLCLAHLMRRCSEMAETATEDSSEFPDAVKVLFKKALHLRDRQNAGQITKHGILVALGRIEKDLSRHLRQDHQTEENARLARHLIKHERSLFTFLREEGIEATNWKAEQAIRPAVANRKMSGGNRTEKGARTQAILMTLLRTCSQRGIEPHVFLSALARSSDPERVIMEALGP